jgi:hypothetical protein
MWIPLSCLRNNLQQESATLHKHNLIFDYSRHLQLEETLISCQMEYDLNFFINGRQPQPPPPPYDEAFPNLKEGCLSSFEIFISFNTG